MLLTVTRQQRPSLTSPPAGLSVLLWLLGHSMSLSLTTNTRNTRDKTGEQGGRQVKSNQILVIWRQFTTKLSHDTLHVE